MEKRGVGPGVSARVSVQGPPSAGSPGWRGQPPHATLPCSGCRASQGGGSSLDLPALVAPAASCPRPAPRGPLVPSKTVSILLWVSQCGCKPQPLTGSWHCRRPGEPGSWPPFRDESTEDPRGHSHAPGSQLGSSRTSPQSPWRMWSQSASNPASLLPGHSRD